MSQSSRYALYGSGVFTTIRVINGEPWLWEKHWRRLVTSAERLGIDISHYSEYMLRRALDESIPDNQRSIPQKARITCADERPARLWGDERPPFPTSVSAIVAPLRDVARPFRVAASPRTINSMSPIAGLKTSNYLDQLITLGEAMSLGINEAIRVNERGHVTSGCMANVFWLQGGGLFTPALSTGCLPGTTREFICESFRVTEVEVGIEALTKADAIFLTSAGLAVVRVDEFDGRVMPGVEHEVLSIVPT